MNINFFHNLSIYANDSVLKFLGCYINANNSDIKILSSGYSNTDTVKIVYFSMRGISLQ